MSELEIINDNVQEIPGTAQIRKISSYMTSMEMLVLCGTLAKEGLDKKLWSVLSRVYSDGKGFEGQYEVGMEEPVNDILASDIPSQLKLQTFTSFQLPESLLPELDIITNLVKDCDSKRLNIAAYFINNYKLSTSLYSLIISNQELFSNVIKLISEDELIKLYEKIIDSESKECITGAIRLFGKTKRKLLHKNKKAITELTAKVFESKSVFFTSKLLFCSTFQVPHDVIVSEKNLDKVLRISINYEEKVTKNFIKEYNLRFDCSDKAMCGYYIGNKKSANEKALVGKFAAHVVRIEDERDKAYLLRGAFKRGGYFRMYAGCMQDGYIDPEKMKRFHYSPEDVAWCATLPGLNKSRQQED